MLLLHFQMQTIHTPNCCWTWIGGWDDKDSSSKLHTMFNFFSEMSSCKKLDFAFVHQKSKKSKKWLFLKINCCIVRMWIWKSMHMINIANTVQLDEETHVVWNWPNKLDKCTYCFVCRTICYPTCWFIWWVFLETIPSYHHHHHISVFKPCNLQQMNKIISE